uniref:PX domain-containing protein n=1 Tax=Buteo japonicus TaxID=224669 RepID=A0A8C0BHT9_9AVES
MGKGFALTVGPEGHQGGAVWVPHALCSFPLAVLQLRQLFGNAVPAFPPKFYLVMTKSMADERRSQLEQYLQNVFPKCKGVVSH